MCVFGQQWVGSNSNHANSRHVRIHLGERGCLGVSQGPDGTMHWLLSSRKIVSRMCNSFSEIRSSRLSARSARRKLPSRPARTPIHSADDTHSIPPRRQSAVREHGWCGWTSTRRLMAALLLMATRSFDRARSAATRKTSRPSGHLLVPVVSTLAEQQDPHQLRSWDHEREPCP